MKMQICNPLSHIKNALTATDHSHTSQPQVTPIDHNEVLSILSSDRRRWAVEYLADQSADSTVTVSDLAEFVAARENDCTVEELSSKQRERVYISFVQSHLITMQGILGYNEDRKTVTPTESPARIWAAYRAFCDSLDG